MFEEWQVKNDACLVTCSKPRTTRSQSPRKEKWESWLLQPLGRALSQDKQESWRWLLLIRNRSISWTWMPQTRPPARPTKRPGVPRTSLAELWREGTGLKCSFARGELKCRFPPSMLPSVTEAGPGCALAAGPAGRSKGAPRCLQRALRTSGRAGAPAGLCSCSCSSHCGTGAAEKRFGCSLSPRFFAF